MKYLLGSACLVLLGGCVFPPPDCQDLCDRIDDGVARSLHGSLTAQEGYAEEHQRFVVTKSQKKLFEAVGYKNSKQLKDKKVSSFLAGEGKVADFYDVYIPVSTADEFVMRAYPKSEQVHGYSAKIVKVGSKTVRAVCESHNIGQSASDAKLVDGQLECLR